MEVYWKIPSYQSCIFKPRLTCVCTLSIVDTSLEIIIRENKEGHFITKIDNRKVKSDSKERNHKRHHVYTVFTLVIQKQIDSYKIKEKGKTF